MLNKKTLSLEEAELIVNAALAKSKELGIGSVICVCDSSGWPIIVKRPLGLPRHEGRRVSAYTVLHQYVVKAEDLLNFG